MKSILILLFSALVTLALGQNKNHVVFKLPRNAKYASGKVLVKVKTEFKDQVSQISGPLQKMSIRSVLPVVKPELAKKGAAWRGPLAYQPVIDISRYFSVRYEPGLDIEDFINKLYETGYFDIIEPEYAYSTHFTPSDPDLAQQYYLNTIKALAAWDITQGNEDMTIAIVDTGGDLNHPDLVDNLYVNPRENPSNGIDDDNDGYIDNYRGWDFIGADTLNLLDPNFKGDNDPSVHEGGEISHGTWVAGCASATTNNGTGIAGVGFKTKLMFTKHTADNQKTVGGFIYEGYNGILYAANQGIKIINISWGGPSQSQIMQDLINHVTLDLGCLVVSSAGNGVNSTPSYPAAYDHVLSVAATDQNDAKASFTTFGNTIDLSAPGVNIFTTGYDNIYSIVSGTSFSSPITAGAAALVWAKNPSFTGLQVGEQLRVSSDAQALYSANPNSALQLGKGQLDIQRALTLDLPSVRASNPKFVNENGQAVQPGQKGFLTVDFTNYLKATSGGLQVLMSNTSSYITFTKNSVTPGSIATNSTITNTLTPFELTINPNVPENTVLNLLLAYSDGSYSDFQFISILVNPSFIDVNSNLVTTTVSGIGRIGYQDPDRSAEGSGFVFDQQPLLFEMGLMMGTSANDLYNNVRGIGGAFDEDFSSTVKITQSIPGQRSAAEIFGEFSNSLTPSQQSIVIDYRSLVWKDSPYDKFVILEYKIKNPTNQAINGFHFGLFADWDITGTNDAANWYPAEKLGYVYPAQVSVKPYAGIQLLTGSPGYYAIDNDQSISGNPFGLYDGFTDVEKFTTLSTQRLTAGLSTPAGDDVSHVVSAGPLSIGAGQEITVAFALHAAANLHDLITSAAYADSIYNYTLKAPVPVVDTISVCYNTPATITASGATKLKWYKTFTDGVSFFTGGQYTTDSLTSDTTFYVSNSDSSYESVRTPAAVTLKANPKITTSGPLAICEGQSIQLSVSDADSYLWNTGAVTKTIQVSTADTFSVTVKYNALSCESTSSAVISTLNPNPQAAFSISGDVAVPSSQTFTDASTGAVSWYWQFGDGSSSTAENPTYTYTQANSFMVTLTVTSDFGCQNSVSNSVSVITGLANEESISVYPNPVYYDPLVVEMSEKAGTSVKLTLVNMVGQAIYEEEFQTGEEKFSREIPLNNLPQGIYIMKIKVGNSVITKKIVKAQ